MITRNAMTLDAPLSRWFLLAPVLSSLACASVVSVFGAVSEAHTRFGAIAPVAFAGLIGWRTAEILLHRAQDRRLARLANEAMAVDPELRDVPIKVALSRGGLAAFDEWIGWYRVFRFVAVLSSESATPECLHLLRSERVQRRVAEVLLRALKRNGWIEGVDHRTLLVAPRGGPSGSSPDHASDATSRRSDDRDSESGA
jgi:hypothetical protein